MDNDHKYLKWGICAVLALGIGFFALPILASMALDAVTIVIALLFIGATVMFLPALSEVAAQWAVALKEWAWKSNPTIKLRRDWAEFNEEIEEIEKNIGETAASVNGSARDLRQLEGDMNPDQVKEWQNNIEALKAGVQSLVESRDDMKARSNEMDREIRQLEAEWKMGNSLGRAVKSLNKAGQIAEGTAGSRVSAEAIRAKLDTSMAELHVIRSRKPEDWKKLRTKTPVNVHPTVAETSALENNPSEGLMAITNYAGKTIHVPIEQKKEFTRMPRKDLA
jgi:septal ring factor EnvC (AmiA/AmiB activator)